MFSTVYMKMQRKWPRKTTPQIRSVYPGEGLNNGDHKWALAILKNYPSGPQI